MAKSLCPQTWDWASHIEVMDEAIFDVACGRIKKLLITMPPRHGKSEHCSHWTPVWFLSNYPHKRVILSGYGGDFAKEWGRKVRNTIRDNSRKLGVNISQDSASVSQWNLKGHDGGMYAVGVGGPLTGRGGHLLVCDDPVKNDEEARSQVYRDKLWDWWRQTFITRLEPAGGIILIQTRWHHDDLAGRILAHEGDEWTVLNFPAIAGPDDPLGRAVGEALWPERYPIDVLEAKRRSMGELDFCSLYQQRPSLEQGNLVKTEWWQWYATLPEEQPIVTVQSYDTAVKLKEMNDRTAMQQWTAYPGGRYLERLWAERLEIPELVRRVVAEFEVACKKGRRPRYVLIEDKSSGQQLIQMLQRETQLPVLPMKAETDKLSRLKPHLPTVETGQCYLPLPQEAPAIQDFIQEIAAFPLGRFDDQVDTFSMALAKLDDIGTGSILVTF